MHVDPAFPSWELIWNEDSKDTEPPIYRHRNLGVFVEHVDTERGCFYEVRGGGADGARFPSFAVAALAVNTVR